MNIEDVSVICERGNSICVGFAGSCVPARTVPKNGSICTTINTHTHEQLIGKFVRGKYVIVTVKASSSRENNEEVASSVFEDWGAAGVYLLCEPVAVALATETDPVRVVQLDLHSVTASFVSSGQTQKFYCTETIKFGEAAELPKCHDAGRKDERQKQEFCTALLEGAPDNAKRPRGSNTTSSGSVGKLMSRLTNYSQDKVICVGEAASDPIVSAAWSEFISSSSFDADDALLLPQPELAIYYCASFFAAAIAEDADQVFISAAEFAEHGPSIVHFRCAM